MDFNEYVNSLPPAKEAARIADGMRFLVSLKEKSAAVVSRAVVPKVPTFKSAVSALNTKLPRTPSTPISPGQRGSGVKARIARAPAPPPMQKRAFLHWLPSAAKNTVGKVGGGLADDFADLRTSASAYKAGLSHGRKPEKTIADSWKYRTKKRLGMKLNDEEAAFERGPTYYSAYKRGKDAQETGGAGDLLYRLNAESRNDRGNITPFSAMRGLMTTGVVGPETVAGIGKRVAQHATGTTEAALQAEKRRKLLLAGGIGAGGIAAGGLAAQRMSKKNAESE